ncbi:Nif3-like dinuclear metal center hexameric protein [Candidatus Protochlamydia phocaeensis]|uniref:Nif3-like dinuclear metal center hexameric protein n=1 Tax=Candidatus Protochlamydia phocaeensis TaxID=1414722 RepID=UPI0008385DBE|nr:Nif3-like dinuclear metal center hexameric protein [Candidatus Protochlamydia phocaeensis]
MLRLKDLCQYLDELLPSNGLSDYCPNGLQVEGKTSIGKLATAVSASLETIEAAIESRADALIVHHGIFWQRDSYVIQGVKRRKLFLLIEQEISLLAYHLPLDMHPKLGNNWKAAQDLGWTDLQPFAYMNGIPIGVKGKIPPTNREKVKEQLEHYYQHAAACAFGGPETIQTLALVSGGAYKSIADAAKEGVDAFITGNFDEPVWPQAFEEGINFFALGHSATERVGPQALAKHLEQALHLPCPFLDIHNPF